MIEIFLSLMMYAQPAISCRTEFYKNDCNTCQASVCTDGERSWLESAQCTMLYCGVDANVSTNP